jgi:hypothetical protein
MDVRLLSQTEFDRVHFYRVVTLLILLAIGVLALSHIVKGTAALVSPVPLVALAMSGRFAVEWFRVAKCQPAFIHNDELVLCGEHSHRQIPMSQVSSVKTKHSLFMVRRYRSWSEHVAFLQLTLNDGERVYTLVESAVFELPAAKSTLKAVEAAVLCAKMNAIAKRQ